jgi:hypothetical protein
MFAVQIPPTVCVVLQWQFLWSESHAQNNGISLSSFLQEEGATSYFEQERPTRPLQLFESFCAGQCSNGEERVTS